MKMRIVAGSAALLMAVATTTAAAPAQAAAQQQSTTTVSKKYSISKAVRLPNSAPACGTLTVSGTVQATKYSGWRSVDGPGPMKVYELKDIRVVNPKMTAKLYSCKDSSKPKKVSGALRQNIRADDVPCNLLKDFSFSYPWGISFSVKKGCARKERSAEWGKAHNADTKFTQYKQVTLKWPSNDYRLQVEKTRRATTCVHFKGKLTTVKKGKDYESAWNEIGKVCLEA